MVLAREGARRGRGGCVVLLTVAALFGATGGVMAQETGAPAAAASGAPAGVLEAAANGAVDWSQGLVTAYGEGAVSPTAPNPGAARLGAIRAAKADAMRNLLELVRKVKVTSETTVENAMVSSDVIRVKVEGLIQGATPVGEPVYLSDTTVRVTMSLPLASNLADAVLPSGAFNAQAPTSFAPIPKAQGVFTGLVIDARGLKAKPAMAPKVLDPAGSEVYGTGQVNRDYAVQQGMVGYARTVDGAKKDARVTDDPMVIKATKVLGAGQCDVEISEADAKAVREAAARLSFLEQCRVVILVD